MPILVRKAKMRLTYREKKPEVHVVRRLTYPKVTGKQLVQYAANAAVIPPSRCPHYRSRSRHGNSWHECRTTSSSRRSPRWESITTWVRCKRSFNDTPSADEEKTNKNRWKQIKTISSSTTSLPSQPRRTCFYLFLLVFFCFFFVRRRRNSCIELTLSQRTE